jgi:hypothetical protein
MDCNNYRGISVLNTTYKLFSKRLKSFIDEALGEYKIGFRREREINNGQHTCNKKYP